LRETFPSLNLFSPACLGFNLSLRGFPAKSVMGISTTLKFPFDYSLPKASKLSSIVLVSFPFRPFLLNEASVFLKRRDKPPFSTFPFCLEPGFFWNFPPRTYPPLSMHEPLPSFKSPFLPAHLYDRRLGLRSFLLLNYQLPPFFSHFSFFGPPSARVSFLDVRLPRSFPFLPIPPS